MSLIIIEDKAQQDKKHELKHLYWEQSGIYFERYPLPVGDYILYNDMVADVISRKQKRGIELKKLDFLGTYNVCVDTKKDMQEIVGNICGKQHERFRDECILAQNNSIKLYVLIENECGVTCVNDVFSWHNERLDIYVADRNNVVGYWKNGSPRYGRKRKYPFATKGQQLAKAMLTMQKKYGVEFLFCKPNEAGEKIIELLTRE